MRRWRSLFSWLRLEAIRRAVPAVLRQEHVERRGGVLYPAYGVDARPNLPPEVLLVYLSPHAGHFHEGLEPRPGPVCRQRPVDVAQPHRSQRPIVPDERRDIHHGADGDEVQKPPQTLLAVRVPELPGHRPG